YSQRSLIGGRPPGVAKHESHKIRVPQRVREALLRSRTGGRACRAHSEATYIALWGASGVGSQRDPWRSDRGPGSHRRAAVDRRLPGGSTRQAVEHLPTPSVPTIDTAEECTCPGLAASPAGSVCYTAAPS